MDKSCENIREVLLDIQRQEHEALDDFNRQYTTLVSQFNDTINELADKRRKMLMDPTALQATLKATLTDVERCFSEMSLREISGACRPVDERYQSHGTIAWPRFWLYALLGCKITRKRISSFDRHILVYLRDIRCHIIADEAASDAFEIEMEFAENPFFCNTSLKRRFLLDKEGAEPYATPIDWKSSAEELAEELPSCDSDFEYDDYNDSSTAYVSMLDFFQPFKDNVDDINMGLAIKEKISRDPLKYVLIYESLRKGEPVEESDDEEESGTSNEPGGRYPFSWLF
ncbi:Nucleosome assembly protein (NAP) family protein [Babesia bovis T2Bo]|uniref:Nucleosome assembly protein n=1 Tax=Babesia bovis TaxID=5865 RepID=A7ATS4_BABBO|nr:Nucleosome assembly protein (NAP) family protein [Babesia bovis T2Bo]EDO06335.1 Nucleosome assembly protein (NAP) family protein [Babesia bovis T2Bo]|eukprot:XP_001609903.1 hypothetical protein [Babesia bovis T2Bo]